MKGWESYFLPQGEGKLSTTWERLLVLWERGGKEGKWDVPVTLIPDFLST